MEHDPVSIYEVSALTGGDSACCEQLILYPDCLDGGRKVWRFADYAQVSRVPATEAIPFARLIFLTAEDVRAGVKIILTPFLPEENQILFPVLNYGADALNRYVEELFAEVDTAFRRFTGQNPTAVLQ